MLGRRRFSIRCACGETLEALSKEGLSSILRTHVLFEHRSVRGESAADGSRTVLEVVSQ